MTIELRETKKTAELRNGHQVVGVAAVQLTPQSFQAEKGILLRVPGDSDTVPNTAPVWVAQTPNVTSDSVETGGFPLAPGESISLPVNDPSKLYVISTAADQTIAWMGI
jgi:hypothetical protein